MARDRVFQLGNARITDVHRTQEGYTGGHAQ